MKKIFILILCLSMLSVTTACSTKKENLLLKQLGYSQDDVVLIINADDLGMHENLTDAALDLINKEVIKSTSIMVPCPDFDRAASLLVEQNISTGIHITLTNEWQSSHGWGPTLSLEKVTSLTNEAGYMWSDNKSLYENANVDEVAMEMKNQLLSAYEKGLDITHIDAHMYAYMNDPVYLTQIMGLAFEYKLPILISKLSKKELMKMDAFNRLEDDLRLIIPDTYTSFYMGVEKNIIEKKYRDYLKHLKPGVHVLAIHPAFNTEGMNEVIKDIRLRHNDYTIWNSEEIKELMIDMDIKLIGFNEIRTLQRTKWDDEFQESFTKDETSDE